MNELLQQMARSTEMAELYDRYYQACVKSGDDDILDYDTVVGGFARAIVQECCTMVNKHVQWNNPNDCLLVLDIKEKFEIGN